MKKILIIPVLLLSACGGTEPVRDVSRVTDGAHPVGMSYQEFSRSSINKGADYNAVQKRFLLLDRDNNGVLSPNEFSE